MANLAVNTFANILRVPHPEFLEYEAYDDFGDAVDLSGLGLKHAEHNAEKGGKQDVAQQLLLTLRGLTNQSDLDFDENGCINIYSNNVPIYVVIFDEHSYLRIAAPIISELEASHRFFVCINDINASMPLIHFFFLKEPFMGLPIFQ